MSREFEKKGLIKCANTNCGEYFKPNKSAGRPKIYCDAVCRRQHQYVVDHVPKYSDKTGVDPYTGETFRKSKSDQIYANKQNYQKHRYELSKTSTKKTVPDVESKCNYCGKKFLSFRGANLCSNSCRVNFTKQYRFPDYVHKDIEINNDSFIEEDQIGYIYIDCVFDKVDLSYVKFTKAKFIRCDFDSCLFNYTLLEGVIFDDCEFFGNNRGEGTFITLCRVPAGLELENPIKVTGRASETRARLQKALENKANYYD